MEFTITSALFAIIFLLTIVHLLTHKSRKGSLVDKIPGPTFLPIVGNSWQLLVQPEALWIFLRSLADDYYPISKFWVCHLPVVNIRHPDDVEILLSSQQNIDKSMFYDFLHPWLKEGLLTSTGNKWRMRRKTLTPAFHFNVLQEFVAVFIENSERMVASLREEQGETVKDLVPFVAKHTLNTICETAMGTGLVDDDPLQDRYRKGVRHMGDVLYYRAVRPWLKLDWLFYLTAKGREQLKCLKDLHCFTSKIIRERKEYHDSTGGHYLKKISLENEETLDPSTPAYDITLKKKRLAMLDLLIASQKERKDIDDPGIREEVDTFVFEGHDTTAQGMCFAIFLLADHKEIQARAREEVDAAFKQAKGKLDMNDLNNLSYLDRCIKESLRMFPSVPTIARQISKEIQLKHALIPRGALANIQIIDVHRDPNFWPQPQVFDPDRFLPERIRDRHPFSYIPFSGGPRNCIGQKFAMLELKAFIAYLLHNFYMETVTQFASLRMIPDLVIKSVNALDVRFIPIER